MATIDTASVINFPTPSGQWAQPTHYALHSASSGWDPFATDALASRPSQPESGDTVAIAVGALSIAVTAGSGFNEAMVRALLLLWSFDATHVSLHTASPTAGNELSGSSYARARIGSLN